jgi:hypothetical protein
LIFLYIFCREKEIVNSATIIFSYFFMSSTAVSRSANIVPNSSC